MPSYSYETTMTTTSSTSSSSSSRAKSESRCSSVSSKVGFWQLEEMQEEVPPRKNFKYKDKSDIKQLQKTQLTFFLKKLDEEFYSGLNLSDGERLRLARYMERIFCDCVNFEKRNFYGFHIPVYESDIWIRLHLKRFFTVVVQLNHSKFYLTGSFIILPTLLFPETTTQGFK